MNVEARIMVNVSTYDVDRMGSIPKAVADYLDIEESILIDLDQWTWQYESMAEYDWDERKAAAGISCFTGESFAPPGEPGQEVN